MKIPLGVKPSSSGPLACPAPEGDKLNFPRLHIDLDKDRLDLIDNLKDTGRAKIEYEFVGMSTDSEFGEMGSVKLKIKSIEPITGKSEDDDDTGLDSNEAFDKFIKKRKSKE